MPESLSNQIAAGEVIDRPSSVVKELVENAIDAGATEITVIVQDGGKTLIQVVDNGCGMVESDAVLAFERHSTSKIAAPGDLSRIRTMGFRGEALASIASVARVEVKTSAGGEATHLQIEGGVIRHLGRTAFQRGTSIAVKSLFFNTPARRKFLKSHQAEYRHILQVAYRYFLAFPEIHFRFFRGEQEVFNLPPAALRERIAQVYGERYGRNVVPVQFETAAGAVHGFVGNMDLFRTSRGEQFLFLNRRYIQSKSLNWAVLSAYESMLPKGAYPFYVVLLRLSPDKVDVNVHPSKIEVRFEDERAVYGLVFRAVKEALLQGGVAPVLRPPESGQEEFETVPLPKASGVPGSPAPQHSASAAPADQAFKFEFRNRRQEIEALPFPEPSAKEREHQPQPRRPLEHVSVWQLHNKYLFSQIKSGLIIVDQHLAHERILYEKALKMFKDARPVAQQQLFPKTAELSAEDFEVLLEMQFYLSRLGFIVKEFGKNTVIIEAVPSELKNRDEEKVLREMIDDYRRNKEPDIREKIAKTFACKSAIKAGDPLTQEEMVYLIDNLFATENPYFCPHGRPVIVTVPLEELDRRFLRL